jgi:hypothetical protein
MSKGYSLDLTEAFYSVFGFPKSEIVSFWDICSREQQLSTKYSYLDIYRKKINNRTVLSTRDSQYSIFGFFPLRSNEVNSAIAFRIDYDDLNFTNNEDRTSIIGKSYLNSITASIQYAATKGIGLIGAGLYVNPGELIADLNVKSFPTSSDEAMNEFFLKWLEPSFGENLNISSRINVYKMQLWASTPISDIYRLQLTVHKKMWGSNFVANYFNSTNKIELNGERTLELPIKNKETVTSLSLNSNDKFLQNLELGLLLNGIELTTNNNPPHFTDFETLGGGKLSYYGLFTNCILQNSLWKIHLGLSYSSINSSSFNMNTPVLGYYEDLAPISHGVKGEIQNGTSFSQKLGCELNIKVSGFLNNFSMLYIHSRYDLWIKGDALLEFGIISTPIDDPVNLDANLWDLKYEIMYIAKNFNIHYSVEQLIPIFKRLDDSTVSLKSDVHGVETDNMGGLIHTFYISFPI